MKQYWLKFHALGQRWPGPMQTRWQHPYHVVCARIARARLDSVTQSACVVHSLSLTKAQWWQMGLDIRDWSEIFKRGNFLLKMTYAHVHGSDENKHDKVTFQLAAVDLIAVHVWPEIFVTDIVF